MGIFIKNKYKRIVKNGVGDQSLKTIQGSNIRNYIIEHNGYHIEKWVKKNYHKGDLIYVNRNGVDIIYKCVFSHNSFVYNYMSAVGFITSYSKAGINRVLWEEFDTKAQINFKENLSKFLLNKNVVVVGPSPIVIGEGLGEFIDSFDVVIKMNGGLDIKNKDDYGSKCDILFTNHFYTKSVKNLTKNCENNSVKFLITKTNTNLKSDKVYIDCWERYDYDKLYGLNAPLTGLHAIHTLITHSVKSITLVGMDFYQNTYVDGYLPDTFVYDKTKNDQSHDYLKHENVIKKLMIDNDIKLINKKLDLPNE